MGPIHSCSRVELLYIYGVNFKMCRLLKREGRTLSFCVGGKIYDYLSIR